MKVLRNGRLLGSGGGCHSIYDASEVIDPENDDYKQDKVAQQLFAEAGIPDRYVEPRYDRNDYEA
jgi:hypothetical protein